MDIKFEMIRVELAGGVYLSNRAFSHMRARHAEEEDADARARMCGGRVPVTSGVSRSAAWPQTDGGGG